MIRMVPYKATVVATYCVKAINATLIVTIKKGSKACKGPSKIQISAFLPNKLIRTMQVMCQKLKYEQLPIIVTL